ncbi:2,3-diketo-5-methylthiopentyl-1-phosphate enolase [Alicyclobacillus shizuokensis]|uniref:2,3-diketo-5-methylthiopentyl-1-phosphate enolase n=1 Tax=Alicyclobacillus shizuokensis TaxID=392014 RepID=UPI0008372A2E|nr:2,3-diketo-5-methylthiopentyl-1-phosphate enolase [Alicyclobacillus shizuokensis]MCL6625506.1 2,3-diketo-5-methylthiopentyl-1-phosphate enolase [Alicyclobacillus shizuokensis]
MDNHTAPYVLATYELEDKPSALEKRAEGIAVGLTVGSWTDLPAAKQASMQPYRGVVEGIEIQEELTADRVRARITIGYPVANLVPSIAALLTTVFGKLSMDGVIRLVDLRLPTAYVRQFPGPKLGVQGVRERLGVGERPLVMSIFKSCIGQTLEELTGHFREQALGGVDLIKDDEIFFSETLAAPEARVQRFREAAAEIEDELGKPVLYAVNLSGPIFDLRDRARRLVELGASALLLNVVAFGYDALQHLAADPEVAVPILAHPAISGALYGAPHHGIASHIVLGQLMRLAGADVAIFPSPYGSVTLPVEEGQALVAALRETNGLRTVLPAPSAGVHPGLVPNIVRDFGHNVILNAGGAIHGHPQGATGGGRAFLAAAEAVAQGVPLAEAAEASEPLRLALERWGLPA